MRIKAILIVAFILAVGANVKVLALDSRGQDDGLDGAHMIGRSGPDDHGLDSGLAGDLTLLDNAAPPGESDSDEFAALTPEPTTMSILAFGGLLIALVRRLRPRTSKAG